MKIRFTGSEYNMTTGKVYEVVEHDKMDTELPYRVEADNEMERWVRGYDAEVVNDDAELEALRAWKASALARFPDLATPETDDDFAGRMADQYAGEYESELTKAFLETIRWARANPR